MVFCLCGQDFRSSSVDLRIRSTEDCWLAGGKGEGLLSSDHNLFLAKPWCSSKPKFANCNRHITITSA